MADNKQSQNNKRHNGLRLVKGAVDSSDSIDSGSNMESSDKTKTHVKSPLIKQLNALADAIENDVKMILNL